MSPYSGERMQALANLRRAEAMLSSAEALIAQVAQGIPELKPQVFLVVAHTREALKALVSLLRAARSRLEAR